MDRKRLAGITSEIEAQVKLIAMVSDRLQSRVDEGLDKPSQLDSAAFQTHNLYCAVEDLLKLIAKNFENHIGSGGDWHRVLLLRMSQPVRGIRPAFLQEDSLAAMNKLRGFRHFVRHAYGMEIEIDQLQSNLRAAQNLYQLISRDADVFLKTLTGPED